MVFVYPRVEAVKVIIKETILVLSIVASNPAKACGKRRVMQRVVQVRCLIRRTKNRI